MFLNCIFFWHVLVSLKSYNIKKDNDDKYEK